MFGPGEIHRAHNGNRTPVNTTTAAVPAAPTSTPTATVTPEGDTAMEGDDTSATQQAPDVDTGQQTAEEELLTGQPAARKPSRRPALEVGTERNPRDFSDLRKDVQRALGVSNAIDQWLYLHGEEMVVAGRGKLQQVTPLLLSSRLADRIAFINTSHPEGAPPVRKPANPPALAIQAIHQDRENIGLPEVDRMAHTPFYGPDATLQSEPGYHPKARTLYVQTPDLTIPNIPERPTPEQVADAKSLILDDLLTDFPFADKSSDPDKIGEWRKTSGHLAGALACAITPFMRTMINGPTPLHLIDSPDSRTGKGLLMEMLLAPSSGHNYEVTAAPHSPDEWQKTVVSVLRPGPIAAIFDNSNARIDSGALASAVTAYPLWSSRLLGVHVQVRMPLPAVWVMTGNNLTTSREIANRAIWTRIDARMADPGQRTDFKHANLREWSIEHRGEIIAALLTLVQTWIAAGRPIPTNLPVMGGFEAWIRVIGSILAFHGIKGLLNNRDLLVDHLDDEASQWEGLIGLMANGGRLPGEIVEEADGSTPSADPAARQTAWTAAELVTILGITGVDPPVDLGVGASLSAQASRLGKALRSNRDRRFGDHILRVKTSKGQRRWTLDTV